MAKSPNLNAPPVKTNNRWVHAAPSTIQGRGLFARTDIPAGTAIVEYAGPRLRADEGRKQAASGNAYVFAVNRRETIDGSVAWNLGRHTNHSCAPNAKSIAKGPSIWLEALRDIASGEEITYDYGYSFRDDPTPCHCSASTCRGTIVSAHTADVNNGR